MALTRRRFLGVTGMAGAGLLLPWRGLVRGASVQALPGGTLDPSSIPKYATPLVIPPAMPRTGKIRVKGGRNIDYYEIAVRQFEQQVLPAGHPATTLWSYGEAHHPGSFHYPAFTIEAKSDRPVRVTWVNGLLDADGHYLPHILPVDQTLHWANPPGPPDMHGMDGSAYTGPVPLVTHVHGAHTSDDSDGYAEAWYLPHANDVPAVYARHGAWYGPFRESFKEAWGVDWAPGTATFQYPNDQRATTLWYHDHTLGMTRVNVYAGPAGFYLLRGGKSDLPPGVLPGPAPALGDAPGVRYYEIPLAIQDRSFDADGSLFYPASREFFDGFAGPYVGDPVLDSDVPPIWNPEFFGNTMVVNGHTWPVLLVEPRRYRFRLLNGCNSRFLILKLIAGDPRGRPGTPALPFWQIGSDGGFLPEPAMLEALLMAPAERADVVVDFNGLPEGTEIFLINEGPDEPFGGGVAGTEFPWADPETTGQVMKLVVRRQRRGDRSLPADQITLPYAARLGRETVTRRLSLNEQDSAVLAEVGPVAATLGGLDEHGDPVPLRWMDPITESPALEATEVWEIYNFTADAHPIHVHQVMFEVVGRQALVTDAEGMAEPPARVVGPERPPESGEAGFRDTVIAYPGEVTRIKARFDLAGLYVWHCHIVEHEDNEMMRPYRVGPGPTGE